MGFDKEGYWSPREILGYNAKYMIILSDRGRGKTVSLKKFMLSQDGEFMCLYRDSPDMEYAIETWVEDLVRFDGRSWEDFSFEGDKETGHTLYYQGNIKGFFRYLSGVNHVKHENFPETLNFIWLDEFIPLVYKKLPGVKSEGDSLRTIMKTIDHDSVHPRETRGLKRLRCFLVGNPHDWNNPLLSYFHVDPAVGYGVHWVGPDIVVESIKPIEEMEHSKPTADDFLGDEVYKANGWQSQVAFIKSAPKGSVPVMSIRCHRRYYKILKDNSSQLYVEEMSQHANVKKGWRYGSTDGLQPDEKNLLSGGILKTLKTMIINGAFYYKDINVKFDLQNDLNEL